MPRPMIPLRSAPPWRGDVRVEYRRHGSNHGHIATYNEGLDWASADYVLLLSADDLLTPCALRRAVGFLDLHPEVGLAYGRHIDFRTGQTLPEAATAPGMRRPGPVLRGIPRDRLRPGTYADRVARGHRAEPRTSGRGGLPPGVPAQRRYRASGSGWRRWPPSVSSMPIRPIGAGTTAT